MKSTCIEALEQWVSWMRQEVLPFWMAKGRHGKEGWFARRLTVRGGLVDEQQVFLGTQAQMIYIVARAEQAGWVEGTRRLTHDLIGVCGRYGTLPCRSDGYVRLISNQADILDQHFDLADHALFLLASTSMFAAYNEGSDFRRAGNILEWLNRLFACNNGGWEQGNYAEKTRFSRSHRQMLLAFILLYQITGKSVWQQRASEVYSLFRDKFYDAAKGVVHQRFDSSWNVLDEKAEVDLQEQLAWVHALCEYRGIVEQSVPSADIYRSTLALLASQSNEGAAVTAQRILAGLALLQRGVDVEADVTQKMAGFFQNFVPGKTQGSFVDATGADENSTGSVDVLFLLFESALQADRLLRAPR